MSIQEGYMSQERYVYMKHARACKKIDKINQKSLLYLGHSINDFAYLREESFVCLNYTQRIRLINFMMRKTSVYLKVVARDLFATLRDLLVQEFPYHCEKRWRKREGERRRNANEEIRLNREVHKLISSRFQDILREFVCRTSQVC